MAIETTTTTKMDIEDTEEWQASLRGKRLVWDIFNEQDGYGIVETSKAVGDAPNDSFGVKSHGRPQFIATDGEGFAFIEVKTKTQNSGYRIHRISGEKRQALDKTDYDYYHHLQDRTGIPVMLVFYEEPIRKLQYGLLDNVTKVDQTDADQAAAYFGGKHVVFLRREDMTAVDDSYIHDGVSYVNGVSVGSLDKRPALSLHAIGFDGVRKPEWEHAIEDMMDEDASV